MGNRKSASLTIRAPQEGQPYARFLANGPLELAGLRDSAVTSHFREHGVLLFRGFVLDLPAFETFTERFGRRFTRNLTAGRDQVSKTIQTVNRGCEEFALHPEMSWAPDQPEICWFACVEAPAEGGETTLCDGTTIANELSPSSRTLCLQRRLRYRRRVSEEALPRLRERLSRRGSMQVDGSAGFQYVVDGESLYQDYYAPVLHRPKFQPDDLAWGNFLLFSRCTLRESDYPTFEDGSSIPDALVEEVAVIASRHTYAHAWQPGDLLMIDNTRFLHGRRPYPSNQIDRRLIWTRFGDARFS